MAPKGGQARAVRIAGRPRESGGRTAEGRTHNMILSTEKVCDVRGVPRGRYQANGKARGAQPFPLD